MDVAGPKSSLMLHLGKKVFNLPQNTECKLNVHETFTKRPTSSERLIYVQFTSTVQRDGYKICR